VAKHQEHEEHVNHEAWVIPYADMLTLLFCLFVVLWALANQANSELAKYKDVAARISAGFAGDTAQVQVLDGGGASILDTAGNVGTIQPNDQAIAAAIAAQERENAQKQQTEQEREDLKDLQQQISTVANERGIGNSLNFRQEARGLVVTIVSDQVLFAPGSAEFAAGGSDVLVAVVDALRNSPNALQIEGHTDNVPLSNARYGSNWELSSARATSVLRFMVESLGFPGDRITAGAYGDTKPIADNTTADGRAKNRRVEIVVLTRAAASATGTTAAP
jgi:chemotaxis protein MotB